MRYVVHPAAFRRLCVETGVFEPAERGGKIQPPSGGCVLKLSDGKKVTKSLPQPPSGGCVLKHV